MQPLRYVPLSESDITLTNNISLFEEEASAPIQDLRIAKTIEEHLNSQIWLLEKDQNISFPNISIDETKNIFTLADFVKMQEERRKEDVKLSSSAASSQNKQKLSPDQLVELKEFGRLSVPSFNFQGQQHVWQVHPSFYSGPKEATSRFQVGLGRTIDHLVVYEQDAVTSKTQRPSLRRAVDDGFLRGVSLVESSFRDLLLGVRHTPKYNDTEIDCIIKEVEYLYVQHHMQTIVPGFRDARTDGNHWRSMDWENILKDVEWLRQLEYIPSDPEKEKINRRRAIDKVGTKSFQIDQDMKRRKRTTEFDINKENLQQSPLQAKREKQIAEKKWNEKVQWELINVLQNSDDIILQTEGNRLYFEQVNSQVVSDDLNELGELSSDYERQLRRKRPILSLSESWRKRKVEKYQQKVRNRQEKNRLSRVIEKLKNTAQGGGENKELFVARPLELSKRFQQDEAPKLRASLQKARVSPSSVKFLILKLNSNKWYEDRYGKFRMVEVDRSRSFWRTKCLWYRFLKASTTLGGASWHFLISGPLSLKALLSRRPYYADEQWTTTGVIPTSLTPTFASRLESYYDTLKNIRRRFEETPDLGLVGKSIQRAFLRLYLGAKATLGTLAISTYMVCGTIVAGVINSSIVILSPVLGGLYAVGMAVVDLLWPLCSLTIQMPYYVLVPGLLQALGSFGLLVVHPILGVASLCWSTLPYSWTSLRDMVTWPIIQRNGKIPAVDTFLAKRVRGPGLSSEYFYLLPKKQTLYAVQALLEYYRMIAHAEFRRSEILQPFQEFHNLLGDIISPFGFNASLIVPGPEEICQNILCLKKQNTIIPEPDTRFFLDSSQRERGNSCEFWDQLAARIRKAHPDFHRFTHLNNSYRSKASFSNHDEEILSWYENHESEISKSSSNAAVMYCVMANRSGRILSELVLRSRFRERRLSEICALPDGVHGKFCLPEEEMQDLWKATLKLTRQYADQIRTDLLLLAEKCEFKDKLLPIANDLADSFWKVAGARPSQDVEVVASHILSLVVGGDLMLEPMEKVDEALLLIPKFSEEDDHLDVLGLQPAAPDYVLIDNSGEIS